MKADDTGMRAHEIGWIITLKGATLSASFEVKGSFEKALTELEETECEMPFTVLHVEMQRWVDLRPKQ